MRIVLCLCVLACATSQQTSSTQYDGVASWPASIPVPNGNQEVGNIRARLLVTDDFDAVQAHVVWRRRDFQPQLKDLLLFSADTGLQIMNLYTVNVTREFGDFFFQPLYGLGEYHLYYMPYTQLGSGPAFAVDTVYQSASNTADPAWSQRFVNSWQSLPAAQVLEIQSRLPFERTDVMQLIALQSEVQALVAANPDREVLFFPEDRAFPLKMFADLPMRWAQNGASTQFSGSARRGEFYTFQLGVYAVTGSVTATEAVYSGLKLQGARGDGQDVDPSAFTCFNLGGVDASGNTFVRNLTVPQQSVNALWFGVQLPVDLVPGVYTGQITVTFAQPVPEAVIGVSITITTADALTDSGDGDLWRLARLRWLNSVAGRTNDTVAPFQNVTLDGSTIGGTGRSGTVQPNGLLGSITSNGIGVLAQPIAFSLYSEGQPLRWAVSAPFAVVAETPASVAWTATLSCGVATVRVSGEWFFDGYVEASLLLSASQPFTADDVQLQLAVTDEAAVFLMGLGHQGRFRSYAGNVTWQWQTGVGNNMVWLGSVDAGVRLRLKGNTVDWESPTYIIEQLPDSWANGGLGGCNVSAGNVVTAYTGPRKFAAGDSQLFRFDLVVTPLKPLDAVKHWSLRYYQMGYPTSNFVPPEQVAATGATVVNIHQGVDGMINPYINYPFQPASVALLANYTAQSHALGMRCKFYYTVRELTNHAEEIWALRTLGDEIYPDGDGGGTAWLYEHVQSNYSACWQQLLTSGEFDSAICDDGESRWINYYVEGLRLSASAPVDIDGVYYDGINFDRDTMLRARRLLDDARGGRGLFDFHSGDNFQPPYGLVSVALQYMHLWPYIDSLWLGEQFNYSETPDYYLVEISGIPFGLFSDMLGTANPWRGMVYGMTTRFECADPSPVWQFWDAYAINETEMHGWWESQPPVSTGRDDVRATSYVRPGQYTIVAVASWCQTATSFTLAVNWTAIGLNSNTAVFKAPLVANYQTPQTWTVSEPISIEPALGWLLVLQDS